MNMAIAEVEKRIHQLEPHYLDALAEYVEYLLFLQKKQIKKHTTAAPAETRATKEQPNGTKLKEEPERLRIARKFAGDVPYPDFPTSKYDVYEQ